MKKIIIGIIVVLIGIHIVGCSLENESQTSIEDSVEISELKVHFIDVGQGDAILLTCGDEAMLIDGGPTDKSDLIYTYLKDNNIDYLKYIIATHPDEDHVGGLSGALNFASAGEAYCSELSKDTEAFNNFLKYLSINNVSLMVPKNETVLTLGSATVTMYIPDYDVNSSSENSNERSIVTKVENAGLTFLFMGDASSSEEDFLAEKYDLKCDVLKIAHHGSESSTSEYFINAVSPKYAVISCGAYNDYGHPTDRVLNLLEDKNIELYRTDLNGDITMSSSEKGISVTKEKNTSDPYATYDSLYSVKKESNEETANSLSQSDVDAESSKENYEITYVLNTNTRTFHYQDCPSVKKITEENKKIVTTTREDLIAQGYSSCGNCHP